MRFSQLVLHNDACELGKSKLQLINISILENSPLNRETHATLD